MPAPPNNLYFVTRKSILDDSPHFLSIFDEAHKKDAKDLTDKLIALNISDNYWIEAIAFNPDPDDILAAEEAYQKEVRA